MQGNKKKSTTEKTLICFKGFRENLIPSAIKAKHLPIKEYITLIKAFL